MIHPHPQGLEVKTVKVLFRVNATCHLSYVSVEMQHVELWNTRTQPCYCRCGVMNHGYIVHYAVEFIWRLESTSEILFSCCLLQLEVIQVGG